MDQPLAVGTAITHISQQWAPRIPGGTAVILEAKGPYSDGSYEYLVRAARDFSRRPGSGNPMDRETWWSSLAVREARSDCTVQWHAHPDKVYGATCKFDD